MIEADVSINAHATKVMDNIMRLLEEIEIYQILNGNDNWSVNIVTKDFETDENFLISIFRRKNGICQQKCGMNKMQ